jgi:hypothetical protein
MVKMIGISGRKQSGKNTIANYINGDVLQGMSMINDFSISAEGELLINTVDSSGTSGYGIFDVIRKDSTFIEYAQRELWPYIKVYHFADYLKDMSVNLFGLNSKNIYGNDDQKNELTDLLWEEMPTETNKTGYMTHREFLEYFGTKVIRKVRSNAWVYATINKITQEDSQLAIIPDVRFPNEVQAIKNSGGIVIRLTRNIFNSDSESESALDSDKFDWHNFDVVIDNHNMTLDSLCSELKTNKFWRF